MRNFPSLLFAAIILCGIYSLIDGLLCGSALGIMLAGGSIIASIYCIKLIKRLFEMREEEE
jgi:hypothetical protein